MKGREKARQVGKEGRKGEGKEGSQVSR